MFALLGTHCMLADSPHQLSSYAWGLFALLSEHCTCVLLEVLGYMQINVLQPRNPTTTKYSTSST
jgi:hypothetical protein